MPINGQYTKSSAENMNPAFTEHCSNVRSVDTQEGKIRIGQRPGEVKVNDAQLGSSGQPIVAICSVAVVENVES